MKKMIMLFLYLVILFVFPLPQLASSTSDYEALRSFKLLSDASNKLYNWNDTTDPCSWHGVSCVQNRIYHLVLEGFDLQNNFETLTKLRDLRVLSLKHNCLSGLIPDLSNLTSLKLLFLSHNKFSGNFPVSVTSLTRLYRLDLSHNNISGQIPPSINSLTRLLTLCLQVNHFTGTISGLNLENLEYFNISENGFIGAIPKTLSAFPITAFYGNPFLCGFPLQSCKNIVSEPSKPGSDSTIIFPFTPVEGNPRVVSSSPTSEPEITTADSTDTDRHNGGKLSRFAITSIVIGDITVLALVSVLLYCCLWRNSTFKRNRKTRDILGEKVMYSSSPCPPQSGFERGKMVFFDGIRRFELDDLLKASAEMLGKGGFGTAYKAVLEDGTAVTVKRLKEVQIGSRREFEQQIEILGGLRYSNIVSLKAYYYARDEKLLVYDFIPNGSLFAILHGNRGPGRTPLDWTTRMKIAAGSARGLAFLHTSKLSHGNLKSTNILIDKQGNACLTDYGLCIFASPSAPRFTGYHAPELIDNRKSSDKGDVYAFGVVLLEILTGKSPLVQDPGNGIADLPRWVQSVVREEWTAEVFDIELMRYKDIEEEMVGMLQIAMACTSLSPNERPKISQVLKMIEEIRGDCSPCYGSFCSISESPIAVVAEAGVLSR